MRGGTFGWVVCPECDRVVAGRIPKDGDGTGGRPHRHRRSSYRREATPGRAQECAGWSCLVQENAPLDRWPLRDSELQGALVEAVETLENNGGDVWPKGRRGRVRGTYRGRFDLEGHWGAGPYVSISQVRRRKFRVLELANGEAGP